MEPWSLGSGRPGFYAAPFHDTFFVDPPTQPADKPVRHYPIDGISNTVLEASDSEMTDEEKQQEESNIESTLFSSTGFQEVIAKNELL
jgi:hypothetical protein